MSIVYRSVRKIEIDADRFSFHRHRFNSDNADRKRSRRVALQGMLYSVILFVTKLFDYINFFTFLANNRSSFAVEILSDIITPTQGKKEEVYFYLILSIFVFLFLFSMPL